MQARTVLITGASTGLGLATARRLLARTPHRLVLTARQSSLARFAAAGIADSDRVVLRPLDVTVAAERRAVVAEATRRFGGIDVLVNNAGVALRSVLEHTDERERRRQLEVNFHGPVELIRLVLPAMRSQRWGRIINVSSVGGMMAMPTMAIYSASKFALEGASEALYYEVRPWNVHVSLVEPGFIHSPSFHNAIFTRQSLRSSADRHDGYHGHYEHMAPFIARLMRGSLASHASVARVLVRTLRRRHPPLRVAGTVDAHVFSLLRRFFPRSLYHFALYHAMPHVGRWGHPELDAPEAPARLGR